MRTKFLAIPFLFLFILASCSNNNSEEKLQKTILGNARKYHDINAASLAMQTLLAIDSVKYAPYKDSLLLTYAYGGAEAQAVWLGKTLLEKNAKDTSTLKILANACNNLGLNNEAIKYFGTLYEITGKPGYLYEVVIINFRDKRMDNCETALATIEKLPEANRKNAKIIFSYEGGRRQNVPIDVALANLHGMIEQQKGDAGKAEEYFKEAITAMPDFIDANNNLQRLKK